MDQPELFLRLLRRALTWRTILDISLMTFLFFFVYHTLRKLGTWKIVVGILIAASGFGLSYYLDLKGIVWIFSNLSQVALIAIIVIFQPELRKLFERVATLRRVGPIGNGNDLASLFSDVIHEMAAARTGAIIVFSGKDPLDRWLSGGQPLNADPSRQLILSLFDHHSPGHDGALIVEGGRLSRFGVRLPVSASDSLNPDYGTRHHAGLGLAEATDALVVVVSEERGRVTIFKNQLVESPLEPLRVTQVIRDHFEANASLSGSSFSGAQWRYAGGLVVSLVLAVLTWASVVAPYGEISERVVTVPIEYTAIPAQYTLTGEKVNEVKLHLAGPKSELETLKIENLRVEIDMSRFGEGKRELYITGAMVDLPKEVKLLDAEPDNLGVTLSQIVRRELEVKPQLVGEPPPGFEIESVSVNPKTVPALVSSETKDEDPSVTTLPIYLFDLNGSQTVMVAVVAPPSVKPADENWPGIEVQIVLKRTVTEESERPEPK